MLTPSGGNDQHHQMQSKQGAVVIDLEISSAVANTAVGQILFQVCSRRLVPLAGVDVQDGGASLQVGQREHQLPVKPAMQESCLALVVRSSGIHWMRASLANESSMAGLRHVY